MVTILPKITQKIFYQRNILILEHNLRKLKYLKMKVIKSHWMSNFVTICCMWKSMLELYLQYQIQWKIGYIKVNTFHFELTI